MHKLVYYTMPQQRADISEHLKNIRFVGDFDDWIYENLKTAILMVNQQIQKNGVTQKDLEKITVPANTKRPEGDKNVYVCGNKLHDGLYNACRFENYMRRKNKDKAISFHDFVQRIIRRAVEAILQDYVSQGLDAEKEALKSNKTQTK